VHRIIRISSFVLIIPIGLFVLAFYEERAKFRPDQTVGPKRAYEVVKHSHILGIGVCRCRPHQNFRLRLPEGFETAASIYDRGDPSPRPGIVFLHGNTWLGRNLSTYRLLASLLADEGFIVLTFDELGFGESDDPFGRGPEAVAAAYNRAAAASTAIDYLIQNTSVDRRRISVFGHSAGVDFAIATGLIRQDIASIVIMVAPPGGRGQPGTKEYRKSAARTLCGVSKICIDLSMVKKFRIGFPGN
jgi:pimeloyl-ACP methyl ester carboxylesterase